MKNLWKLKCSMYADPYDDTLDNCKWDNDWSLYLKKGQIAKRFELTEEVREKFGVYDDLWKSIYVFKNNKYLLSQDEYSDDFATI